ncbi:hypothetical protein PLANPX_0822 [Lacipirellula parvula]|uniref:Uncharacterized protein n=1 Tax=Lacipirellula parvula TaxID=2650471 RepID=A0A5K7X3W4_9BACT|nr:hypothetical protein PLANPX_0822 [Lacipirellula parvula]
MLIRRAGVFGDCGHEAASQKPGLSIAALLENQEKNGKVAPQTISLIQVTCFSLLSDMVRRCGLAMTCWR